MNENKLDLIFEKEPPQVQRKLMNLLIQYNAVMQYNKDEDKFEVDLLLPFKDVEQKEKFVSNFISRKSAHAEEKTVNSIIQAQSLENKTVHNQSMNNEKILNDSLMKLENDEISQISADKVSQRAGYKNRKMSANIMNKSENRSRKFSEKQKSNRDQEQELSLNFTNELDSKGQLSQIQFGINFPKIVATLNRKIQNAVKQIKFNQFPTFRNLEKDKSQESNLQNYAAPLKNPDNPSKIIFEQNDLHSYESEKVDRDPNSREISQNYSDFHSNQILISDSNQFQDVSHSFPYTSERSHKTNDDSHHYIQNHSSFEYPEIKEQKSEDEEDKFQKMNMKEYQKRQKEYQIKQKMNKRYKTNKQKPNSKKPSMAIKQKYADFFKKNHKDINKIYENIRKDMKKNNAKLNEIRVNDPILVLEDNIQDAVSEEDRVFNEEMIQQYSEHIVAQNKNMSSQDLIKYFRYLVQNARSLYIKHITKSK